jgi:RHH-type rel operon transcriptional repressor/antitoxin RelB
MIYMYIKESQNHGGWNMLTVRLPEQIEKRLAALAKKTGRTKTFFVREAILEHLDDLEDFHLAMARLEENLRGIPLKEMERRLGLED